MDDNEYSLEIEQLTLEQVKQLKPKLHQLLNRIGVGAPISVWGNSVAEDGCKQQSPRPDLHS